MSLQEQPPFGRGKTFGTTTVTDGVEWEGREFDFPDIDWSTGARRSNHIVRCRIVRNVGADALLPKSLVSFQATAAVNGRRVDGMADVTAERCYPVDEFLPAAGVSVNDLFYIVVQGPAMCLTSLGGGSTNLIAVGDKLVGETAATSGATTAGRAIPRVLTGASSTGAVLANLVENCIGHALSAKTTAQTNADVLTLIRRID